MLDVVVTKVLHYCNSINFTGVATVSHHWWSSTFWWANFGMLSLYSPNFEIFTLHKSGKFSGIAVRGSNKCILGCIFPAAPFLTSFTLQCWQAQSQQMAMHGQLNIQVQIKCPIYLWKYKYWYIFVYSLLFIHFYLDIQTLKRVSSPGPRHQSRLVT